MATPPTLVAEYETVTFNGTWPKTLSVTTAVGDVLVCKAMHAEYNGASDAFTTPTGGTSLSWSLKQFHNLTANSCLYVWTATATTAETFTLSVGTAGGSPTGGLDVTRWSGASGTIVSSKGNGTGAPSLAITTTADNSAIDAVFGDWNESTITGRAWRAINGTTPTAGNGHELLARDISGQFTAFSAKWPDAGTAGAKTTGLTTPSGTKWTGVAIEIQAATGGSTVSGAMALTGTSALGAAGRVTHKTNPATFASVSVLAGVGRLVAKGNAMALSGTSALGASARVTHKTNPASLASVSTLTGLGRVVAKGNAMGLTGTSVLTGAGRTVAKGNAMALAATSTMGATARLVARGAIGNTAVSVMTIDVDGTVSGAIAFAAASTLTATGRVRAAGAMVLAATSALSGAGRLRARGSMSLASVSALNAVGHMKVQGVIDFLATSTLTVDTVVGGLGPRRVTIFRREPSVTSLGGSLGSTRADIRQGRDG